MTQGVLNIGVRVPQQVAGSKRVKKEESDDEGFGNIPKLPKKIDRVDLTE